ncbi:MAG: M20/M25/M40 family metallo-hydrolase [Anaerolineales bacterium]|jgi:putative aminopeptidase FrvX
MSDSLELLEELTSIPALSGREDLMVAAMSAHFSRYAEDIHIDRLGNVVATIHGEEDQPELIIFAHMDELGLIVRKIEDDGFLRFERVGGVPEKSLLGTPVEVLTDSGERVAGLVGTTSHHVTAPEKKFSVPSRLDMYLDIGCSSRAQVEQLGIQVGDMIAYRPGMIHLAGRRIASKSLDNRIGCLLLIELLERLAGKQPTATIHLVASVQEEFNVRGVWPVFQKVKPDAAICLDVTIACDTPELRHLSDVGLGLGPAIGLYQFHGRGTLGGLIPSPNLRRFIEDTAREGSIPLQREVLIGIITDIAFSQMLTADGVPSASLAVPVRYTHAPLEVCDLDDVSHCVDLLEALAGGYDTELDLSRGVS